MVMVRGDCTMSVGLPRSRSDPSAIEARNHTSTRIASTSDHHPRVRELVLPPAYGSPGVPRRCRNRASTDTHCSSTRSASGKILLLAKRAKARANAKPVDPAEAVVSLNRRIYSQIPPAKAAARSRRSWSGMVSSVQPRPRSGTVGGTRSGIMYRPSITDQGNPATRDSVVSLGSGGGNEEHLLASGNGVSMSITLTEPYLFLQGFEHAEDGDRPTSMVRGYLTVRVSKPAKIRAVTLAFRGRAETDWPEGIPPKKTEYKDRESIMNHTWPFFNAQFPTAEYGSGADSVQALKGPTATTIEVGSHDGVGERPHRPSLIPDPVALAARQAKRSSMDISQSRSVGRDDSPRPGSVAQKGYRTFTPGVYMYNFELPIDSRLPETINVALGNVRYELEAIVERAGAFRANLVGSKEVTLIRAPAEGSLETVEPIAISRNWEDQLHYDIVISGKSFPLGAQVPIAFKLTPLAKVQCHRVKVYVTENIQYYTTNKQVHRLEPIRKIQLFEKRADGKSTSAYSGSSMRITSGGGVAYTHREAAARGDEDIPRDTSNLLGCLDNERSVGPTEMEFNVQLPSCQALRDRDRLPQLHFDTTYQNIQVHHWIKVSRRSPPPSSPLPPLVPSPAGSRSVPLTRDDGSDRDAPLQARPGQPIQTSPLRDLDRLAPPHPLVPRHPSEHRPSRLLVPRIRHHADRAF